MTETKFSRKFHPTILDYKSQSYCDYCDCKLSRMVYRNARQKKATPPRLPWNKTLSKEEAPAYTSDGPYILTGYRPQLRFQQCLKSIFTWHNQTMNIWSSIFLILLNLGMTYYITTSEASSMPMEILCFFWLHGLLRAFCWFNSWLYHTFVCYSQKWAKFLCTLDYVGCYLTPLGIGSNFIFLEFYCHSSLQRALLLVGAVVIGAAIFIAFSPAYQREEYRSFRFLLSITTTLPYLMGIVYAFLFFHQGLIPSYYETLAYGVFIEGIAATFYVSMYPEKCCPGNTIIDCYSNSHSLWHWCNTGFDICMMYMNYQIYLQHLQSHAFTCHV